ncbi:uncharacterized protein [Anolis sagrei]|uniref:uncharacterized protein n=1 Tax=Anolis sagrei TaxID=38937 RepID=UPI0035229E2D
MWALSSICSVLWFLFPGSLGSVNLTQPTAVLALPGGSITLDCVVSGYDINRHHMHWVRQAAGKGLVYIGGFRTGDPVIVDEEFKGRVTPFTSGSTAKLRIDTLTSKDTSVYYCGIVWSLLIFLTTHQRRNRFVIMQCFSYVYSALWLFFSGGLLVVGSPGTITLTQPSEIMALPRDSLTLDCVVSGFNINDHHIHWVREAPGKGLIYIAGFRVGYDTPIANEFKGRVTPSTSGSTAKLRINMLTAEDTAVYYCTRAH